MKSKEEYNKIVFITNAFEMIVIINTSLNSKILGCRDPRYKHEYLDNGQFEEMTEDDESDKRLEALYRRYSCLILGLRRKLLVSY